jgi:hypothetical protein
MKPSLSVVTLLALAVSALAVPVHAQQALCIYTVSPSSLQFEQEGGEAEVRFIASSPDCVATVGSNFSWIKFSHSQEGERGVLKVDVEASRSGSPRKGAVMIGRTQLEIIQKGRNLITW